MPQEHHRSDVNASQSGNRKPAQEKKLRKPLSRKVIFFYDLAVLAMLILVGVLYVKCPHFFTLGGDSLNLAIESMWFGALGGVIISLKGIYDHSGGPGGWDVSYNLWHFGRPLSGAIAGLMTVVLLKAINPKGDPARPVVFAAAFIFGTQEKRFFNFLYEVARLIVQVPEEAKASGLGITEIQPSEGSAGGVVVITGQGLGPHTTVKLGAAAIDKLTVSTNGTSAAGLIPTRPQGADTVDVIVSDDTGASFTVPSAFKFTD